MAAIHQAINQSIQKSPFVLKMYSIFSSDIIHGLAICCCTPPFLFFRALSFLNIRVRLWKAKLPCFATCCKRLPQVPISSSRRQRVISLIVISRSAGVVRAYRKAN